MWLLLVPLLILLVLALMAASLFAGLFWVVGNAWPLLLIGLGAWLFWHEDRRGSGSGHRASRRGRVATPPLMRNGRTARTHDDAARSPIPTPRSPTTELPIDVQVKVEQIRRKVEVLLGYADRFPPFSQDLYLVRQTASDYLPRTINAFLSLPEDSVDRPLSGEAGARSARQELKAQLDLLDSKLDDIAQDLQRQDADRLLANRRFLETRFGSRERVLKGA
jgi:hypothetical protein